MKSTHIVYFVVLFAASCARPAYVVKSDTEKAYMMGQISQLRETYLDSPADVDSLPDTLNPLDTYTVIDYNRAGNIIRHNTFTGPDSVYTVKEEYFYDPSGKRMERAVSYDMQKNGYTTTRYIYDTEHRLVLHIDEMWGWQVDYGYDRHGYLKTQTDITDNRDKPSVTRYHYNRTGLPKRIKNGSVERYRYHDNGVVATIRSGNTEVYRYDKQGNLVEATSIVKNRNRSGLINKRWPATISAEYMYDEHGNWIRRMQLYKGQIVSFTLREITYY